MRVKIQTASQFPAQPILDTASGYAVNIPLGYQESPAFWYSTDGAVIRARILAEREYLGITVDDHLDPMHTTTEDKSAKIRRVRDASYWGLPRGTIIKPGMKPRTADRTATAPAPPKSPAPWVYPKPRVPKPEPHPYVRAEDIPIEPPDTSGLGSQFLSHYHSVQLPPGSTDRQAARDQRAHIEQASERHDTPIVGDLSVETQSTLASTLDAYEEMWPGFGRAVGGVVGDKLPFEEERPEGVATTLAQTLAVQNASDPGVATVGFVPGMAMAKPDDRGRYRDSAELAPGSHSFGKRTKDMGVGYLKLNDKLFGHDGDPSALTLSALLSGPTGDGQMAVDVTKVGAQHPGMSYEEIARLNTINHEIGHLVSFMALKFDWPSTPAWQRTMIKNEFIADLTSILYKHGLLGGTALHPQLGEDGSLPDKDRTKEMLSSYAAASPLEFMAEAWAEYMMDEHPRPLAKEVGEFMRRTIPKYMADLDEAGVK